MNHLLFVLLFIPLFSISQNKKQKKALEAQQKADQLILTNLKNHFNSLSSATAGDPALAYITAQFKTLGLQPMGSNGYLQTFTADDGRQIDNKTSLKINGAQLELNKEYFPLSYSASKTVSGMPAMALRERGVPWFKDVKDWLADTVINADFTIDKAIRKEAAKVAAKGATALFLFNSSNDTQGLYFDKKDKTAPLPIPVVYITTAGFKKYFNDASQMLDIELNTAIKDATHTLNNVVGYLNNNAPASIVVSSVLHASSDPAVTKSDIANAATLLEVAKMIGTTKAKSNNYLFMVSTGELEEEVGAKYMLDHTTLSTPVNYCICVNNNSPFSPDNKLLLNGTTTSPAWKDIIATVSSGDVAVETNFSEVNSGTPAVFYQKDIPGLSFSAGGVDNNLAAPASGDNLQAQLVQAKFICKLIETTDSKGKVAFVKTTDQPTPAVSAKIANEPATAVTATINTTTKNSVSLGVIPDKLNDGEGLKIIGVSPKKIAEKLGLQKGDMLTNLGNYKITDIQTYMTALAGFKPGDKTILKIKRGKEDKEFAVEF